MRSFAELRAESAQLRMDAMRTDAEVCSTLIDMFEIRIKMGNIEAANRALQNAERAYDTVSRLAAREPDSPSRTELARKLDELHSRLTEAREALRQAYSENN